MISSDNANNNPANSIEDAETGIYFYAPSHALAAVFSVIIGLSFMFHIFQNLYVISRSAQPQHLTNTL
jgi:hypothetical protein